MGGVEGPQPQPHTNHVCLCAVDIRYIYLSTYGLDVLRTSNFIASLVQASHTQQDEDDIEHDAYYNSLISILRWRTHILIH